LAQSPSTLFFFINPPPTELYTLSLHELFRSRADVRLPPDGGRQGALDLRPLRGRALDVIGRRPEPHSATKRRSRFAGLRPTPIQIRRAHVSPQVTISARMPSLA